MLTAERRAPRLPGSRHSPGFSLGEAAQIRRDVLTMSSHPECPRCGGELDVVGAKGADDIIWITTCADCRLSLVVHRRAGDLV